jgi:hypothetical protein
MRINHATRAKRAGRAAKATKAANKAMPAVRGRLRGSTVPMPPHRRTRKAFSAGWEQMFGTRPFRCAEEAMWCAALEQAVSAIENGLKALRERRWRSDSLKLGAAEARWFLNCAAYRDTLLVMLDLEPGFWVPALVRHFGGQTELERLAAWSLPASPYTIRGKVRDDDA